MSARPWTEGAARLALGSVCGIASLYGLLCFLPFTWNNFVSNAHYPVWVSVFLKGYGGFLIAAGALGTATLTIKSHRVLFGCIMGGVAGWALGTRGIQGWGNRDASLLWSYGVWVPYLVWELLRHRERPAIQWDPGPSPETDDPWEPLLYGASGLLVSTSLSLSLRHLTPIGSLALTGLLHVLFFLIVWAALDSVRKVATFFQRPVFTEWLLIGALMGVLLERMMTVVVLGALDFRGLAAQGYAVVWALSMVLALGATSRSLLDVQQEKIGRGLSFWLAPFIRGWRWLLARPGGFFIGWVLLAGSPWIFRRMLFGQDWNRLLETLTVMLIWVLAVAFMLAARASFQLRLPAAWRWGFPLGVLLFAWGVGSAQNLPAVVASSNMGSLSASLQDWSESDLSFRWIRRILKRSDVDASLFGLLHRNTNLPRDTTRVSGSVKLGTPPAEPLPLKPNVFIFVVDSLRPDYLGAYNAKVRTTPFFDAFAHESLVFKNAFTVFGATGLSEPSIWAGAHLPHLQYPKPFHPLNALEHLIQTEYSRRLITRDVLLTDILEPTTPTDPLDSETDGTYRLCGTLQELTGKLKALPSPRPPVFVYTQPQDIHISVLEKHPPTLTPNDPRWSGFHAPYAARVAEMDACFGQFVADLKTLGMYDNSLIVLTADHGDSLGEEERWGHAYTIYPEILQVPLIWHVPAGLRAQRTWDVESAAYLIDITPTLYALLGWSLTESSPLVGRTLLRSGTELVSPADRVVASSYGPVYGVLSDQGRRLYIADGVHYQTRSFERDAQGNFRPTALSSDRAKQGRARIESHLADLTAWFGITR